MPSLYSQFLKPLIRFNVGLVLNSGLTPEQSRQRARSLSKVGFPLRGVNRQEVEVNGIPGVWLRSRGDDGPVILYLHGGGYVLGSAASHGDLAARLAQASGGRALIIDYRLAPEHPYPAALNDAVNAYRGLLEAGIEPQHCVIAGDSAGGGLSLATSLRLKEEGLPQPAGLCLSSPWTDLELTGDSVNTLLDREIMLRDVAWLRQSAAHYGGDDLRAPLVSPVNATLQGLPEIYVQVGSDEILLDDSRRLKRQAERDGVPCTLEIWDGMWHTWQLAACLGCPESKRALSAAGDFIFGVTRG